MMEDDPLAAAELKKRSLAFVAELTEAMHEVINKKSTQVGNTKVFMKATFAYTLHRIAEITEDHCTSHLVADVAKRSIYDAQPLTHSLTHSHMLSYPNPFSSALFLSFFLFIQGVRKLQRVVRKYLSQGAALREAARRR